MMNFNKIAFVLLATLLIHCTNNNQFSRSIELNGQSNFRDIGHYSTHTGQIIKTGIVYRSGTLSKLSESDIKTLDSLKVKTVVNFLTAEERKTRGEDRLPDGVKSIYFPISGENQEAKDVLLARETGDFSNVPVELNHNIHALLVDVGKDAYKGLFEVLADEENYPVVFHCSHGIHRTGTATALLFMALDIPWQTTVEDYMLSNTLRGNEIDKRVKALREIAENNDSVLDKKLNLKNIYAFYQLQEGYIEGTKKAVENNYGDITNYLNAIGIETSTVEKIKSNLLKN